MNATILTSVLAAFVFCVNVSANNVKTYSNVESSEFGTKKEYISVDSQSMTPQMKEYYHYNADGKIIEKTVSKWVDNSRGWVNSSRYEYHYGESGLVTAVSYTKWDDGKKVWEGNSEVLVNIYDEDGNFMASKQVKVTDKTNYLLVAQK